MHKIREITVGVCYVDSILERRKKQCVSIVCSISILFSSIFFLNGCEATFLEEKRAVKKRRMKDLHRLQKNCLQRGGCKPDQSALYIKRARSVWD